MTPEITLVEAQDIVAGKKHRKVTEKSTVGPTASVIIAKPCDLPEKKDD